MNNDYEKHFDCDPADCSGYRTDTDGMTETADEFDTQSSNEIETESANEFDTESAKEFNDVPNEYGDSETAKEFGMTNGTNGFFNAPGVLAPIGNPSFAANNVGAEKTDISELYGDEDKYDFESSAELSDTVAKPENQNGVCKQHDSDKCGCGCGKSDDVDCPDCDFESGEDHDVSTDPSDETAATTDSWNCDNDSCDIDGISARGKCELDDYEIISDVLGSEKQLVKLYSTALCESAEEPLRDIIRSNLIECANDQYKTFEFMEERGMYPTEQATDDKITQAKQQFTPLCDCE